MDETLRRSARPSPVPSDLGRKPGKVGLGAGEDRVEGEIDEDERRVPERRRPVALGLQPPYEEQIPRVIAVGRTLGRVDLAAVRALDLELVADVQTRQRSVEARRVVCPLPRVDDRDQTFGRAAFAVQPFVPSLERGDDRFQERPIRRHLVQHANGGREDRRLSEAARGDLRRSLARSGVPQLRARRVVRRGDVEHDVRHHSVAPLALQKRPNLVPSALWIDVRQAEGDERRIPVPLVRVELAARTEERAHVVAGKDRTSPVDERVCLHVRRRQRSARARGREAVR